MVPLERKALVKVHFHAWHVKKRRKRGNNTNSARMVGDAFGHAYTTVTGANGDHVRTLHDTVLAYIFDELKAAGIFFRGGPGNSTKKNILTWHFPEPHRP